MMISNFDSYHFVKHIFLLSCRFEFIVNLTGLRQSLWRQKHILVSYDTRLRESRGKFAVNQQDWRYSVSPRYLNFSQEIMLYIEDFTEV